MTNRFFDIFVQFLRFCSLNIKIHKKRWFLTILKSIVTTWAISQNLEKYRIFRIRNFLDTSMECIVQKYGPDRSSRLGVIKTWILTSFWVKVKVTSRSMNFSNFFSLIFLNFYECYQNIYGFVGLKSKLQNCIVLLKLIFGILLN